MSKKVSEWPCRDCLARRAHAPGLEWKARLVGSRLGCAQVQAARARGVDGRAIGRRSAAEAMTAGERGAARRAAVARVWRVAGIFSVWPTTRQNAREGASGLGQSRTATSTASLLAILVAHRESHRERREVVQRQLYLLTAR